MSEKITIDLSGAEFGNMISTGIFLPHLLWKSGMDIHVITAVDFPDEWMHSWFGNNYTIRNLKSPDPTIHVTSKRGIEDVFFKNKPAEQFYSPMKLPDIPRMIEDKYVVLIPTVYGHNGNDKTGWRIFHALELKVWEELSRIAHDNGYKVIGFGANCSCSEEDLSRISDESFYIRNGKDTKPLNKRLPIQLQWMKNAQTCVAVGGAIHLSMCFDVPGIGYDGQIYSNYGSFSNLIAKNRESKLSYIQHGPTFEKMVKKRIGNKEVPRNFFECYRQKGINKDVGEIVRECWGTLFIDEFKNAIGADAKENNINEKIEIKNNKKSVSFIIPSLNRPTLPNAIKSLQNQTDDDWDAIVCFDDRHHNNIDSSTKITYYNHPPLPEGTPRGAGIIRNYAISKAESDWVAFLDDDDIVTPDYISRFKEELKNNPDADVIVFRMLYNDYKRFLPRKGIEKKAFGVGWIGISFAVRRSIFNKIKFVDDRTEDYGLLNNIRKQIKDSNFVFSKYATYLIKFKDYNEKIKDRKFALELELGDNFKSKEIPNFIVSKNGSVLKGKVISR